MGSEVKGSSVSQNISKGKASLWKGCVNKNISEGKASLWKGCVNLFLLVQLFTGGHSQIIYELNKGTLVYSQAEGQGPLRQALMTVITKAVKSSDTNSSNVESELASSLQH